MPGIKLYKEKSKLNQVNKFIVPFAFHDQKKEKGLEGLVQELCEALDSRWSMHKAAAENNELYEHISSLVQSGFQEVEEERNNSIAYMLRMRKEHEAFPKMNFTCKKLTPNAIFNINEIDLFLFRTGIGFLVISLNYDKLEYLEDVIEANFQFKAIKHSALYSYELHRKDILLKDIKSTETDTAKCHKVFNTQDRGQPFYAAKEDVGIEDKLIDDIRLITVNNEKLIRVSYHTISDDPVDFKMIVKDLLSELEVETFFNQYVSDSLQKKFTNKANIFSIVISGEQNMENDETEKMFFRLRHGYSQNYDIDKDVCSDRAAEIYRPFCNSIWGFTREGVANLVYPENDFIKYEYLNRAETYFLLYIIVLHQYYGLLHLAQQISYLPIKMESFHEVKYQRILTELRHECNIFYLKCMFDEVSHITHQAVYYERLMDIMGIKKMQLEINHEMEHITTIVEQIKMQKVAEEKEKKDCHDSKIQFIMSFLGTIFSIIAFVATFDDALSFWTNVGAVNEYFNGYEIMNAVLTMGVLLFIIVSAFVVMIICINKKNKTCNKESGNKINDGNFI